MEDAKKRWSVTYTKHIKQKRKVYQDGFLDLHISTSKVKLYDECEKLLECKFLKQDEVVSSGEALTFNAYLVDVGDPEGGCEAIPDLNPEGRDRKISEQSSLHRRQKLRSYSISSGCKKIDAEKKQVEPGSLSPSKKFIREFKKREMQKYGTPRSSPEKTNPGMTEWKVLYTTQLTQKAKKYHDGFLRVAACGSMGRQVMLYDDGRKLLNSRFLRKDDIIESGGSITFDAHLVDIGEPQGIHQAKMDVNTQGNNHNVGLKTGIMHGHQNCLNSDKSVVKGKPQNKACPKEITDATCTISAVGRIKSSKAVSTNKPLRNAIQILSILQKPEGLEVSEAVLDVPGDSQEPSKNMDTGKPNEDLDIGNFPDDLMSSKSICSDPGNDRRISSEEPKSPSKMVELPSFDLGF